MNSTTYAKRTEYKPIDLFFRGVVDVRAKTKKVAFVDVFEILNDRYLGRMNVCNYFAVAENSVRINELNVIALEELKNYNLVFKENYLIPDNLIYSMPISTRFLENDADFNILLSALKDCGYKKGSLILAFYGTTLERLDGDAKKRYVRLRRGGYKTAVAQFGEDYNSLDVFAGVTFDYLRCEAAYFDSTPSKKKLLAMLVKFCNANKISLVMEGVDSPGQLARFKREGVKLLTGRAVSKLSRFVTNEMLYLQEPVGEKRDAYLQKLQKELDAKQKAEFAELLALRKAAAERAKNENGEEVLPASPRPELAKSPYQVRLEQQRNAAKRAAEMRLNAQMIVQNPQSSQDSKRLITEMSRMRYQGDVQSALALSFAYEKKSELGVEKPAEQGIDVHKDKDGRAFVTEEESGISAPVRPDDRQGAQKKSKKKLQADLDKQAQLLEEYRTGGMFGDLGSASGVGGFGVTMRVDGDSGAPSIIGSYNEKGQWVDEDGNVFNGYFDSEGKWTEYERFDGEKEGGYNDSGQWVDGDGNVYDGYFDEEGRWIDYTYTDSRGEVVDNGYFDDKLGKWVPFGYFEEDGSYHRF